MKVHINGVNFSSTSGPNSFGTRLAKALFKLEHEVVFSPSEADVSLVFIEPQGELAPVVVQRLDGIWFSPTNYHTHNHRIKALWNSATGVIYQSNFDKRLIEKHWDVHKNSAVISNGVEIKPVEKFTIPALEQMRQHYKMMFCCSANWHGQKRLQANIEMFKHIRATIESSSCLLVLGRLEERMMPDKDIFYAGSLSHDDCAQVYSACNWMIHLSWLDHCPNSVVECLAQNTPVICSRDGGTREIVKDFGVIINEKNQYDFSLVDYDNPPEIDVTQLKTLPTQSTLGAAIDVDVLHVAQKYVEHLQHCMKTMQTQSF